MSDGGNAPSWLFSFVDLAFLLMIAMTQLTEDAPVEAPNLGELVVPRHPDGSPVDPPMPNVAADSQDGPG